MSLSSATGVSPVCAPVDGNASCDATDTSLRSFALKDEMCTAGGEMTTSLLSWDG